MGTLTDQPVHRPGTFLHVAAEDVLLRAKALAKAEDVPLELALKAFAVASRERLVELGYSLHNVHDEHVNGFAKMLGAHWDVSVP